jgi:hypothetical protein
MTREELIEARTKYLFEENKAHDEEYGSTLEDYREESIADVDWFAAQGLGTSEPLKIPSELPLTNTANKCIRRFVEVNPHGAFVPLK